MVFVFDIENILGLISGIAMASLGVVLAGVRPRRPGATLFSLFAILWGVQVSVANVMAITTNEGLATALFKLNIALVAALYLPALLLVDRLVGTQLSRRPLRIVLLATPGLLAWLMLAASPSLFVDGLASRPDGTFVSRPGPLYIPVVATGALILFWSALAALAMKLAREPRRASRERLSLIVGAFLAYTSYQAATALLYAANAPAAPDTAAGIAATIFTWVGMGGSFVVATGTVAFGLRRPDLLPRDLVLVCGVLPFAVGIGEWLLADAGILGLRTVGLWRLLMVGLFAYAIARYSLFDIELKLKRSAPSLAYTLAAAIGLGVLWGAWGARLVEAPGWGAMASLGVLGLCAPVVRLTGRALDRSVAHVADPQYLYKRKIDVYRAALEGVDGASMGDATESKFLTELRRSLGISEGEHRMLLVFLEAEEKYGPSRPNSSGSADDRFDMVRELGRGSFGLAILVRDRSLGREVVLKRPLAPWVLEGDGRERFLREARTAARLNHPNVVTIHDVQDDDTPVIVMEHVEGGSLDDIIRRDGRIPVARACAIAQDILAGLTAIHEAQIVHRDLKPHNVLLTKEGRAKITDFGVAHLPPGSDAAATLVGSAGAQPGSLGFMSPEQARGDPIDERSDLYAVGVMLYRMLMGRHYVDLRRTNDFEARRKIQHDDPRDLDEHVPAPLRDIVLRSLAKDPAARWPDAQAMADALAAAQAAAPVVDVPVDRGDAPDATLRP